MFVVLFLKRGKRGERFMHEAFAAFCRVLVGAQLRSPGASVALLGRCKGCFLLGGPWGCLWDAFGKLRQGRRSAPLAILKTW